MKLLYFFLSDSFQKVGIDPIVISEIGKKGGESKVLTIKYLMLDIWGLEKM